MRNVRSGAPWGLVLAALALVGTAHAQATGACRPTPPPGALGTICGFDRPEDLELVPTAGIVLASALRPGGGLHALSLAAIGRPDAEARRVWPPPDPPSPLPPPVSPPPGDPTCTAPPPDAAFFSHGLGSRELAPGLVRLAVVNHGARESVELFDLVGSGDTARLHWMGCVPLPDDATGNDVALAPDGEVVVTKFVARAEGWGARIRELGAAAGFETGEVLAWRAGGKGWRRVAGTRGAGPNGVVVSADGGSLWFAENGRQRLVRVPIGGATADAPPLVVDLGHHVDNLSWTPQGTILAVLHTGGWRSLFQPCLLDWAIVEVDPRAAEPTPREVLRHDGATLCGATSALQSEGRLLIGSMSEDRIGVWRPRDAARGETGSRGP